MRKEKKRARRREREKKVGKKNRARETFGKTATD